MAETITKPLPLDQTAEAITKPRPVDETAEVTSPLPVDQTAEITKPAAVDQTAQAITKPRLVAETEKARQLRISAVRLGSVVDRSTRLSDEVLESLEANQRAAIEALGQFVIAIEEAFPQEVAVTSEVAKKLTESGLQMADRMVHTLHDFLRNVIGSAAKSLSSREEAQRQAAR